VAKSPVEDLARDKWQASGLTGVQAKKAGIKALSGEEVAKMAPNFHPVGALYLPYFDLEGAGTGFYRIRYLEPLPGFAGIVEKPQRYAQPAKTINEAYLPPLLDRKWKVVAADKEVTIYITEGELKAACGCAHGLATIGLGGVDVWRSAKRGIPLLKPLDQIVWEGRKVVIVYDSDAATNLGVVRAQRQLASALLHLGARPFIASLPPTKDGAKQGLDDFLVANGIEALEKILSDAPMLPEADALWGMNTEVLYVREPGIVVERESGRRMAPNDFVKHAYANRHFIKTEIKNGVAFAKKAPLAPQWIQWERRFEVQRVTYAPGEPELSNGQWNVWRGWGTAPTPGDVSPWTKLLDRLFDHDPKARKWFEQWCAYPIQHPGAKLYTSSVLWGVAKGTGKTMVAYALMKIYGQNSIEIKSKDLKGGFNSWAENRQFVYGDEITGGDARVDSDWLKGLITQSMVRINAKYIPEFTIPDRMNYLFTSNHPDALFLEDGDRRYFVHEIIGPPLPGEFYKECHAWLHGSGPSHLMHHLLNVDLTGFEPRGHAPDTVSKRNMILNGKSDLGAWCVMLKEDPYSSLRPLGDKVALECDLYTAAQLLRAYEATAGHSGRVTAPGMARELVRSGFRQVNGSQPVWTVHGTQRLYAVRNHEKWMGVTDPKECAAHYAAAFLGNSKM
jgi:hypothetical protein